MNDAEIKLQVSLDSSSAEKAIDKVKDKTEKLAKSFTNAGKKLTVGLTLPIAALATAAVSGALELEATEAKYNTVFEGMTEDADAFIEEFQKLTPATTAEARSMASGIQDLLVPLGIARDEATEMTGDTMTLVGALTNFNSATHTAEEVSSAFQSALTGEYTSLKALGIQVDATTVKEKAMEMGLADANGEVDNAAEAQALLELAYEQSGDALAAYNEESLDTKTKLELATSGFKDQIAILGENLIPIITQVIGAFSKLVGWLASLDEGQQKMLLTILGILAVIGPALLIVGKMITALNLVKTAMVGVNLSFIWITLAIIVVIALIILLVKNFDKVKAAAKIVGSFLVSVFTKVLNAIKSVIKGIINAFIGLINLVISGINTLIKGILSPFNLIIKGLNKLPGVNIATLSLSIPKIPSLDVGTNFVAQDGLAFLHQGEAVVPKKYNPVAGNTEQTIYIDIPTIDIDGKSVAKTTTPYMVKVLKQGGAR